MRPVRFLHTSDVHLDTSFSASGFPSRLGVRKREAIRGTFRRMLEEAQPAGIDAVLIAGDLFEHDRVTPDTVEFLRQQFENLGRIRVFIAPGNHDPYLHGSPYHDNSWPSNVHIFHEEEFRSVELADSGLRVTGFAFNHSQLSEHLFQKLQRLPQDAVNVVLAHASDVSRTPEGKAQYAPFAVEEIAGKSIHYCALGHYHQQHQVPNPFDETQVWYCGIPEGRGWDEEGACGYLIGEVRDGQIRIESRYSSQYPLRTMTIDCDDFSTREQIVEEIIKQRGTAFDTKTILRVRLTGSIDPRLDLSTQELSERLAEETLHISWDDRTEPALDFEATAEEKTLRGRFVRTLNERIARAGEEERPVLERTRLYGLQALLGREVRLR
jgi:DNA repair exonuclease SbcCD nuclease subunit